MTRISLRRASQLALFSILSLSSVQAQTQDTLPITLKDILLRAVDHSKVIKYADFQIHEKELAIKQSKTALYPELSVRGSASYATNMPIYDAGLFNKPSHHDVIHYLYDTGLDFYLNLYNGHQDLMKIEASKLEKHAAIINWKSNTGKIKLEVCNLFLELERLYIDQKLISKDIEDQQQQLKEIKHLYNAGTVLYSDVLRIELELSKRELLLVQINHDIQLSNQKLQFITGVNQLIKPITNHKDPILLTQNDAWEIAKTKAYILQKSVNETRIKELTVKQQKAKNLPELGLTGNFTFANPQIFLYPYNDAWYSLGLIGLKIKVPLSNLYKNKHAIQQSKVSLERQEILHHEEEEQVQNLLFQAYLDFDLALKQKDICEKNILLAKENARIIKNRYFQSSALVTDLLDADMQYLKTLFELESAKITIQKKYYFIEFIKGTI